MGLLGIIGKVVGVVLLLLVGIGAYLYFTDYEAKATVTDTTREGNQNYAVITPKILPTWHYRASIPDDAAAFVCKGYQVHFRLQSHAVKVYDETGTTLVYDSTTGKINQLEAFRCASSKGLV